MRLSALVPRLLPLPLKSGTVGMGTRLYRVQIYLQFVPKIFNGIGIRALRRSLPPIDAVLSKELPCSDRCVLWVIILHEAVAVCIYSTKEWEQTNFQKLCLDTS